MDSFVGRAAQIKRTAAMFASLNEEGQVLAALGLGFLACQRSQKSLGSVERFVVEGFEQFNDVPGAGIDLQLVVIDLSSRGDDVDQRHI